MAYEAVTRRSRASGSKKPLVTVEERDYTGSNKGMLRVRGNGTGIGPWEKFQILDTETLQPVHYFFPLMS